MAMSGNPRLDCIGMVVEDMARSLAFYRRLGLDIPPDLDSQPHAEVTLPSGLRLLWDTEATVRSFDSDWRPPTSGGHRVGIAFRLDRPADVDATYEALLAEGHKGHKEPWDAFWGQRYAVVQDPDGNSVDLFSPLG